MSMAAMHLLTFTLLLMVGLSWQRLLELNKADGCHVQVWTDRRHIICGMNGTCVRYHGCKCDEGYTGKACEYQLSGKISDVARTYVMGKCQVQVMQDGTHSICGRNGTCCKKKCVCDVGYAGDTCEYRSSTKIRDIKKIYQERTCHTQVLSDGTNLLCGEHGSCVPNKGCECDKGYQGKACQYVGIDRIKSVVRTYIKKKCYVQQLGTNNEQVLCGEHGKCDPKSGCVCKEGYNGAACEYKLSMKVPGVKATYRKRKCQVQVLQDGTHSICGKHGTCDDTKSKKGCVCDKGFSGSACQYISSTRIPQVNSISLHNCPLAAASNGFQLPCNGRFCVTATGRCKCGYMAGGTYLPSTTEGKACDGAFKLKPTGK